MKKAQFAIGTKFKKRGGKRADIYTVIDILITYNSINEVVKIVYIAETEFAGQIIKDYEVPQSTVALGLVV